MKLKGRFVRYSNPDGSQNQEQCFWEVWKGEEELLLKVTVAELQYLNLPFESIATKEFGKLLLAKTRKQLDNAIDNAATSWDLTQ